MDIREVYPNPRNFAPDFPTLVGRNKVQDRPVALGAVCSVFGAKFQ